MRERWRNKHHMIPRSRKGGGHTNNLLYIDAMLHREWHKVFGNRTWDEVISLLIRVQRAKRNQGGSV